MRVKRKTYGVIVFFIILLLSGLVYAAVTGLLTFSRHCDDFKACSAKYY